MSILGLPEKELFAAGHKACSGCGPALAMRYIAKAAGPDCVIINATGCMEVISTLWPHTSWKVPYIHVAFENAAAVASGVETALRKKGSKTKVIVIGGDGGTFDIGFQALSGMLERGHNITYICYDNGAYMNTGIQRSGATPPYANTTTTPVGSSVRGKKENVKPMPFIAAAHRIPYVATASIAYPLDFHKKLVKSFSIDGPCYIQVFSPCNLGWKFHTSLTIEVAKKAVESGVNLLYEIENGKLKISMKPKFKSLEEYLKLQGRFKHLNAKEVSLIKKNIDSEWEFINSVNRVF